MVYLMRDFSRKTVEELEQIADERVDNDDQWIVIDFFADWAEDLEIEEHIQDLNTYHREMMDLHDIGKKGLQKIVNDVTIVDNAYKNKWSLIVSSLKDYKHMVQNFSRTIHPFTMNNKSVEELKTQFMEAENIYKKNQESIEANYKEIGKQLENYLFNPSIWDTIQGFLGGVGLAITDSVTANWMLLFQLGDSYIYDSGIYEKLEELKTIYHGEMIKGVGNPNAVQIGYQSQIITELIMAAYAAGAGVKMFY